MKTYQILGAPLMAVFALSALAGPAHAKAKAKITYQNADRNRDGMVTLKEWQIESDSAFAGRDWNGDGVLSGNEMKPGAVKPIVSSDPFRALDRNLDGVVVLSEWDGSNATFQQLDTNDNGQLSSAEFHASVDSDQFAALDHNSNGVISRTEWHNSSASFVEMDRNRNEQITRDEFYNQNQYPMSVFRELDVNNDKRISRSEWRDEAEAFTRIDTNGDNLVSETEFNNRQNISIVEQIFKDIFRTR